MAESVKLRPHQIEAQKKLDSSGGSILLNWGTGTGKTIGSIALAEHLHDNKGAKRTMVLTPASLTTNYHNSITKNTGSSAQILGKSRGGDDLDSIRPDTKYVMVSNENFRANGESIIDKIKPDTVIVDEMHKYKDPSSSGHKELLRLRPKFKNMIALTGTTMTNHPKELINLLNIVSNKKHDLGLVSDFDKNYTQQVKKPLKFTDMLMGRKSPLLTLPKNLGHFHKESGKYVHTFQSKPDDMPEKVIKVIPVPMSPVQSKLYNYVMGNKLNFIERWKIKNNWPINTSEARHIFTALMQARQVSNSVHLFDSKYSQDPSAGVEHSPKLKMLTDDVEKHLKEHKDHKAIVYSNFYKGGLDAVRSVLDKKGIKYGMYLGTKYSKPKERDLAVKDYLSGKHRVMLMNQAGTEGVDLPGTTLHAALDGHFNPAVNHQAEARGIRTGSKVKQVHVHRYVTTTPPGFIGSMLGSKPHSADQWVYNIAGKKEDFNNHFKLPS